MTTSYLVVVGIDGSDGGRRALEWAVREAAARDGAVQAVIAWHWDGVEIGPVLAVSAADAEEHARRVAQNDVDALLRRSEGLPPVAVEAIRGRPADVLSRAAQSASLLVLGSHGHSHLRHTVLGSVSEECVRRATCPVVVIPVPAPQPVDLTTEALAQR
ncbi:universal stress protein [Spirilliplanes yamanashiensis]|uniref:Universal stress protein n=1 Tax=Spirilliplanes yamanashiensis TaxID=42233 RepID=A0A8J4DM48_9ACTN|nr:universal stress protein [Spirilliplanes yamanashiensis]MDP9818253.1 nucleotide-binding universal stress UspA family protein [Spirilliplanes yamanashiensis]GIJ06671.1 universal stress protein [Spirilliplanes yamanashiensis]